MTPEEERDNALADLARLRAGLAAGLSPEQSARLHGATAEELTADAQGFATELGIASPPAGQSGGNRGGDVGNVPRTLEAGAARYRERHGLDERPAQRPANLDGGNPFQAPTYRAEH